jgi:hypothetical protein
MNNIKQELKQKVEQKVEQQLGGYPYQVRFVCELCNKQEVVEVTEDNHYQLIDEKPSLTKWITKRLNGTTHNYCVGCFRAMEGI